MSKKLLLFLTGFLTFGLVACNTQKKAQKGDTSSLLWKISGKDLKSPSYLFGTVHLICPDDFLWTKVMEKALAESKQVAFEMDLTDPKLSLEVSAGLMAGSGQSLKDHYSEDEYKIIEQYAKDSLNVSPFILQRMQPFSLLSILTLKSVACKEKAQAVSYEAKITSWAQESEKEIIGLESAQDQLSVIKEMNPDSTAKQLLKLIKEPNEAKKQFAQLIKVYTEQDINALYQLILTSDQMETDLNSVLYKRNNKWIPLIEDIIKKESTFIAVGAGHLAGKGGVIQLLQSAGYKVEPIR